MREATAIHYINEYASPPPLPTPRPPLVDVVGADCAVCADGYARGTSYSCHRCSHESVQSAVGIMVVVSSAILLIAAILISHMWSVVHEKDEGEEKREEERSGSSWGRKFQNCRAMVVRVVPLTAIKIVITVWQIVYQVCGWVLPSRRDVGSAHVVLSILRRTINCIFPTVARSNLQFTV